MYKKKVYINSEKMYLIKVIKKNLIEDQIIGSCASSCLFPNSQIGDQHVTSRIINLSP